MRRGHGLAYGLAVILLRSAVYEGGPASGARRKRK